MTEINFGNTKGARMAQSEKLTNYEKIMSMSIDEMAELINCIDAEGIVDKICRAVNIKNDCDSTDTNVCVKFIKQWLESEVSE